MRAQSPQAQAGARMELQQPDLTAALRDIRTQYESIAVTNLQEAEEGKLSVQPASELNAKIHILLKKPLNPPVTRSPAGFSAGFVSLGQK